MLINLSIKNYALIENLAIDFKDKLTTITGETGAGKSILLGALGLVLGKRADSTTLNSNGNKCVIEAQFSILNYNLDSFFEENDLDFENETIIRREILPGGKSRAFINDTPTTLPVLQALSEKLIDVHSQHQNLKLSDLNFQFKIIDALANNTTTIELYQSVLKSFKQRSKELYELKIQQDKTKEDYEYQLHLFEELKQAHLHNDEQDIIEKSLDKLNNIEEIKLNLSYAQSNALNDEIGLQTLLNSFENNLKSIAPYSNEYKELYDRIVSLNIEFNDVVNEIVGINENVNFDPFELKKLNDRLQLVYDLQKKHAVHTIADLLAIQLELSKKITSLKIFQL